MSVYKKGEKMRKAFTKLLLVLIVCGIPAAVLKFDYASVADMPHHSAPLIKYHPEICLHYQYVYKLYLIGGFIAVGVGSCISSPAIGFACVLVASASVARGLFLMAGYSYGILDPRAWHIF